MNILDHVKLVKYLIKQIYVDKNDYNDIVQAGMIGLIEAIEHFDPSNGVKFSTYAKYWIMRSMINETNNYKRRIRIPKYLNYTNNSRFNEDKIRAIKSWDTTNYRFESLYYDDKEIEIDLSILDDIEFRIIYMFYYKEMNLKEIGEILGFGSDKVFKIKQKALLKLKRDI